MTARDTSEGGGTCVRCKLEQRIGAYGEASEWSTWLKTEITESSDALALLHTTRPAGWEETQHDLFEKMRCRHVSARDLSALIDVEEPVARFVCLWNPGTSELKITDETRKHLAAAKVCEDCSAHVAREKGGTFSVRVWAHGTDRRIGGSYTSLGDALCDALAYEWQLHHARVATDPTRAVGAVLDGLESKGGQASAGILVRLAELETREWGLVRVEMGDLLADTTDEGPTVRGARAAAEGARIEAEIALYKAIGESRETRNSTRQMPRPGNLAPDELLQSLRQGLERTFYAWDQYRDLEPTDKVVEARLGRGPGGSVFNAFLDARNRAVTVINNPERCLELRSQQSLGVSR